MVKAPVRDARVKGIAEKVINPINSECITLDNLAEDRLQIRKRVALPIFRSNRQFRNINRIEMQLLPDVRQSLLVDDLPCNMLVSPAFRKKLLFRGVRKGKVSEVMAKSRHTYGPPPVGQVVAALLGYQSTYRLMRQIVGGGDDIEDP